MPSRFYYSYLASRKWAKKCAKVRRRARGRCERCHSRPLRDTHHKTYVRLGHERLRDLKGLCRPCHDWLHGKTNSDPYALTRWIARIKIIALFLAMAVFIVALI
jgi:hypothetical protein